MALPTLLSVANYRAFARRTEIELRPITLLYGWNSAGKSALLRLLPLVHDSVGADATAALELSGAVGRASSFRDIRWKGGTTEGMDPNLMIGFRWDAPAPLQRIEYRLAYDDDRERVLVKSFCARPRSGPLVEATLVPMPHQGRTRSFTYDIATEGQGEQRLKLQLVGLVPQPTERVPITKDMSALLTELRGVIQWLTTGRGAPPKRIPRSGVAPRRLAPDGRGAADVLRSDPEILREVSAWFEQHFQRRLDVEDAPPSDFRLVFRSLRRPELDVDMADAGEGLVQVLPVLVGAALARREVAEGTPHILAVEEPESNLHPNAQRWLAEHLCAMAASDAPPTLVLETHAYALLLAIQLQIARGKLPHDRVLAYWVEAYPDGSSEAKRVEFDRLGRPGPAGNWPPGIFADQRELAFDLASAQIEQESEA